MTDEAIIIHSILLFNFDFNYKSWNNCNRLSNSRDNNDLSKIKSIITWWKRFEKFNDFSDCNLTIKFRLYLSTSIVDQNKIIFIWIIDLKWQELLTNTERKSLFNLNIRSFINILSKYFNNRLLQMNLL